MGDHRVDGTFKGLAKLVDPPVKVTVTGTLGKAQRQQFKKELIKLLAQKKWNLTVTVTPDT